MPEKALIDIWIFGPERGCLMRAVPVVNRVAEKQPNILIRAIVHREHVKIAESVFSDLDVEIHSYGRGLQFEYNSSFDLRIFKTLINIFIYATAGLVKHFFIFRKLVKKQRPDIIINDFLPFTPLFGSLFNLKTIGLYNYLLIETGLGNSFVKRILSSGTKTAYELMYSLHTHLYIEQIDPDSTNSNYNIVPVVARNTTRNRGAIRDSLNLDSNDKLVFLSLGGGGKTIVSQFLIRFQDNERSSAIKILVSPRSWNEHEMIGREFPEFLLWSPDDFNTQDLVAASDLVICRAGFTTIAESIQHKTPVLLWSMKIHPEIRETEQTLEKLGASTGSLYDSDTNEDISEKIEAALSNQSIKQVLDNLPRNGTEVVAEKIINVLSGKNLPL